MFILETLLLLISLLTVFIFGYSSLAAIITVSLTPLFTYLIKPVYTVPVAMLTLLILIKHHSNIVRLWHGEESKVWDKGKVRE